MRRGDSDGAPPLLRLRLLALIFGAILALTFMEEAFTGGSSSFPAHGGRTTSAAAAAALRARCAPVSRPVEFAAPPSGASLALPGGTALFDADVVAASLGTFGRFLGYQRPSRLRTLSGSPPEWRDRRHTFPILTGDGFRMLADMYAERVADVKTLGTQIVRDDTPLIARLGAEQAIIVFLGNDDPALDAFLEGGYINDAPRPVVLVVLNGDFDGISPANVHLENPKLLAVFAQNCVGAHEKVVCTPIGLENRQWSMHGWTPETIMGSIAGSHHAPSPLERLNASLAPPPPEEPVGGGWVNPDISNLAFACFGVHTWPAERGPLAAKLDDRAAFPWVSRQCNEGLVHFHRRMLAAAVVVCPRGHGLDTLRMWEALYLGRVLVTHAGPLDALWEATGMPVIRLKSWDDLSLERIAEEVRALSTPAALAASRAATPKLFMPYWACLLGQAARRAAEFCSTEALQVALSRAEGA